MTVQRWTIGIPRAHIILFCVILGAVSGCFDSIKRADVVGHYRANHDQGAETLDLFENGIYVHTFSKTHETTIRHEGPWSFFYDTRGTPRIDLRDYILGYRNPRQTSSPKVTSMAPFVERTWLGRIRIPLDDPDLGIFFERQ